MSVGVFKKVFRLIVCMCVYISCTLPVESHGGQKRYPVFSAVIFLPFTFRQGLSVNLGLRLSLLG